MVKNQNLRFLTKEFLIEEYLKKEKSQNIIAKEIGVSVPSIQRRLKKYGIKRRMYTHTARDNHITLTKPLYELIEGELLGDGNISIRRPFRSANYGHSSKHKKYIKWLFKEFEKYGLEKTGTIQKRKSKGGFGYGITYNAFTKNYVELKDLRFKWYPVGKKVIPYDLFISPIVLRQWFLGDGHFAKNSNMVILSTRALILKDVKFLVKKIKEQIEIEPRIFKEKIYGEGKGYSINIKRRDLYEFFNYIGNCPKDIADIFGYKFPSKSELQELFKYKERKHFEEKTYQNKIWLLDRWNDGWTLTKMAQYCGVSLKTVSHYFKQTNIKPKEGAWTKRNKPAKYGDKDWLERELKKKSTRQIGKECNVSHSAILNWKNKFGL